MCNDRMESFVRIRRVNGSKLNSRNVHIPKYVYLNKNINQHWKSAKQKIDNKIYRVSWRNLQNFSEKKNQFRIASSRSKMSRSFRRKNMANAKASDKTWQNNRIVFILYYILKYYKLERVSYAIDHIVSENSIRATKTYPLREIVLFWCIVVDVYHLKRFRFSYTNIIRKSYTIHLIQFEVIIY